MNCSEFSYQCGANCIPLHQVCRIDPAASAGDERLTKLRDLAAKLSRGEVDPRGSRQKPGVIQLLRLHQSVSKSP